MISIISKLVYNKTILLINKRMRLFSQTKTQGAYIVICVTCTRYRSYKIGQPVQVSRFPIPMRKNFFLQKKLFLHFFPPDSQGAINLLINQSEISLPEICYSQLAGGVESGIRPRRLGWDGWEGHKGSFLHRSTAHAFSRLQPFSSYLCAQQLSNAALLSCALAAALCVQVDSAGTTSTKTSSRELLLVH